MFDKIILILNPDVTYPLKACLMVQSLITSGLLFAQMSLLWTIEEFSDVIMNMAALLIINDFDNYVGHYFEQKVG